MPSASSKRPGARSGSFNNCRGTHRCAPTFMPMSSLILKPGREKSLLRRHPWIFSGAVARLDGDPAPGATVDLLAANGQFLARAAYSPSSQIRARVWTFDPSEQVDADFFRKRIHSSLVSRNTWHMARDTDALRLIHAESDGLPGLIVDRYADTLVLQSLTAGSEYWKDTLAELLLELHRSEGYLRTLRRGCARAGGPASQSWPLARQPSPIPILHPRK